MTYVDSIQAKIQLFESTFDAKEFKGLSEYLGQRFQPQREVTQEDIQTDYNHFLRMLRQDDRYFPFIQRYLPMLQPFTQAPFPLPDGHIIQGPWLGDYKVHHFKLLNVTEETIRGKRILDVGCNAGFDTFLMASMQPSQVIGIEPSAFFFQALFLWAVYQAPNVSFMRTRWQDISPANIGTFDLVNCQGIFYHEPHPQMLLDALFALLKPGGRLILETHVTIADDMNALFVERSFWGEENWWWIPSGRVMTAMLRASGYVDAEMIVRYPVPSRNPDDPDRTIEGLPVGGRAFFSAHRPVEIGWRKPS